MNLMCFCIIEIFFGIVVTVVCCFDRIRISSWDNHISDSAIEFCEFNTIQEQIEFEIKRRNYLVVTCVLLIGFLFLCTFLTGNVIFYLFSIAVYCNFVSRIKVSLRGDKVLQSALKKWLSKVGNSLLEDSKDKVRIAENIIQYEVERGWVYYSRIIYLFATALLFMCTYGDISLEGFFHFFMAFVWSVPFFLVLFYKEDVL